MGKRNFRNLYQRLKREQGTVTCEISMYSDKFNPFYKYAGVIIYSVDGNFEWENHGMNSGWPYGSRGRSFYIIIQCTDKWPADYYRPLGQGTVHDYLLKNVVGIESDQKRISCGGFAYVYGELKFSSIWLNGTDQLDGETDGSRYMSDPERALVTYCWEEYKRHGGHHVFTIPYALDQQLLD